MKCNVWYYDVGNSWLIKKDIDADSMEDLKIKARNYAGTLVDKGLQVIGWDYKHIKEDF